MTADDAAPKRNLKGRSKVKTGCGTCRIRKIKCDEGKPYCHKCVGTGRNCDGYESPFRFHAPKTAHAASTTGWPSSCSVPPEHARTPPQIQISPRDVELLSRCFSTKTVFDVKLDCDAEAGRVLEASRMDPTLRCAISSLRALRDDFEASGEDTDTPLAQPSPGHDYGIQQYCMALGGTASNLSLSSLGGLKSALFCCQIFISIEQVRGHYTAMAQHIIQGLGIMHGYRARPALTPTNELIPAHHGRLPLIDVFVIKLFAAPCKFAEPPTRGNATPPGCPIGMHPGLRKPDDPRKIAPDMRAKLTKIATATNEFLDNLSHVESVEEASRLRTTKTSLLEALDSWLVEVPATTTELVSVSFMRLFHQLLRVILVGTLDPPVASHVDLQAENDALLSVAGHVGERVKDYKMASGS